jgi:hypothetical protein
VVVGIMIEKSIILATILISVGINTPTLFISNMKEPF